MVRERSRVQSSLAAPAKSKQFQDLGARGSKPSERFAAEHNANQSQNDPSRREKSGKFVRGPFLRRKLWVSLQAASSNGGRLERYYVDPDGLDECADGVAKDTDAELARATAAIHAERADEIEPIMAEFEAIAERADELREIGRAHV